VARSRRAAALTLLPAVEVHGAAALLLERLLHGLRQLLHALKGRLDLRRGGGQPGASLGRRAAGGASAGRGEAGGGAPTMASLRSCDVNLDLNASPSMSVTNTTLRQRGGAPRRGRRGGGPGGGGGGAELGHGGHPGGVDQARSALTYRARRAPGCRASASRRSACAWRGRSAPRSALCSDQRLAPPSALRLALNGRGWRAARQSVARAEGKRVRGAWVARADDRWIAAAVAPCLFRQRARAGRGRNQELPQRSPWLAGGSPFTNVDREAAAAARPPPARLPPR
jgi:hypothetical protein